MNGAWEDPGRGGHPGRPGGKPWAAGGEALGGRGGGRWAAGGEAGRVRGIFVGSWNSLQGASVGGTTLVAPNGPKRSQNRRFPEGAGPAPQPESQPPMSAAHRPHGVQFRVLLELRCSLTDAQSASGAKSGLPRGG